MKKITCIIIRIIFILILLTILLIGTGFLYYETNNSFLKSKSKIILAENESGSIEKENKVNTDTKVELPGEKVEIITEIDDWRLILVNSENPLPENFSIELAKVNGSKEFDARVAGELTRNDTSYESIRSFKHLDSISI